MTHKTDKQKQSVMTAEERLLKCKLNRIDAMYERLHQSPYPSIKTRTRWYVRFDQLKLNLINQFKTEVCDDLLAWLVSERGIEFTQEDIIAVAERSLNAPEPE